MIKVYLQKWKKEDLPWEWVLADILQKEYKMEPCPEIVRDPQGKPYLKDCQLHFNVSHSGEYLAIAVSENPVGVDIQGEKEIYEGMYTRVVQPKEQRLIGDERQKDFLRLWTLKESFVKAEGKGLKIPMKDYYFERIKGNYFVNYGGQRAFWKFKIEEKAVPGYFISVCGMEDQVLWKVNEYRQCSTKQEIL